MSSLSKTEHTLVLLPKLGLVDSAFRKVDVQLRTDNYKAALKAHKNLDDQSISYSAKNGTLVLKGSVKAQAQWNETKKLARAVPNVKQVVNKIEVKPAKHSTSH